ncbi:flagellar biosynthetic protein FliO [Geomonas subterranea]|uniref:Flagellar protein n=1 Tax=Geomonas subterranea TaxID=2847989 RepID=A0ABX8LE42_9BACT|nr:flagellar biosynthetic protein FliO [Geomonas subterranea]QXE90277.1 flagellar biosynthetic protein FliO [Geomonas subterranea]QXM07598.1 flagellar biosynthetic protein FliO [Geomonas subterranea]
MRKLAAVTTATLLIPAAAHADSGGPDLLGSLAQMVGSLILVIGIILILYYLAGRLMKMPQGKSAGYIRVVETRHLAPKKSLMLVEVGGEYLLLSNSGEGVSLIKQVEMLEEIELVEERSAAALIPGRLRKKLETLAGGLPRKEAPLGQLGKSGGFA